MKDWGCVYICMVRDDLYEIPPNIWTINYVIYDIQFLFLANFYFTTTLEIKAICEHMWWDVSGIYLSLKHFARGLWCLRKLTYCKPENIVCYVIACKGTFSHDLTLEIASKTPS